jgi:beta-galactosidase
MSRNTFNSIFQPGEGFMFLPQRVMKGFIGACAAVLFSSALSAVSAAQVVRFHDAWKYYNGDVSGAQDPAYNDASWATVYLPHPKSLAAVGGAASTGYCWYRKTFSGASLVGKKLFLEFQ